MRKAKLTALHFDILMKLTRSKPVLWIEEMYLQEEENYSTDNGKLFTRR